MDRSDPGSVRAEAERLVVTALAAARSLVSAGPVAHFAEDATCCSCPVCRGIRVLREPSPEFAERLASGAGDLAAGVASLLRSFNPGSAGAPRSRPAPEAGETEPEGADSGDHHPESPREAAPAEAETAQNTEAGAGGGSAGFGNEADRRGAAGGGPGPDAERDVWAAATREASRDDDAGGRGERQR